MLLIVSYSRGFQNILKTFYMRKIENNVLMFNEYGMKSEIS